MIGKIHKMVSVLRSPLQGLFQSDEGWPYADFREDLPTQHHTATIRSIEPVVQDPGLAWPMLDSNDLVAEGIEESWRGEDDGK